MGIPDHLACLLRNLYAGQEATEPDMEQQTDSKLGKEYIKAIYCHSAYLTYMQSISCKMPSWMKHKLESRFPGKFHNLRYTDDTTVMAENEEELKSLLMKVKEESEKADLKLNIQKHRSWHPVPSLQFSSSVVSDSLGPHGQQYARLPCQLRTPRPYSNSCSLSL